MARDGPRQASDAAWQAAEPERTPTRAFRFPLTAFDDITFSAADASLIKGLIPREGVVAIWGRPKCGKSFLVHDMLMHISLGWDYRGRRVKQGPVVYVCLEGVRGLAGRIEAFRRTHPDAAGAPFYVIATSLNLAADAADLVRDIRAQLPGITPVAICIDTLNRSLAGSESSDEDMGAYIQAADRVRDGFHCVVVIVHHCGHDDTRMRGHSSLLGAIDAEFAVKRDAANRIVATLGSVKDGPEGDVLVSTLRVVEIGHDEDGNPVTSCVVEVAEGGMAATRSLRKLSGRQQLAFEKLLDIIARAGTSAIASDHIPVRAKVVTLDQWRDHLVLAGVIQTTGISTGRTGWLRVQSELLAKGRIGIWGNHVWIV